jgi:ABC-2 type transport system permease protein
MAGVHGVSQTIANERLFGAINNVFISPAGRVPLYLGRTWPHVVIGGLTSAAGLGIAALVFGLSLPADRWTALVLVVVVTVVSCCGMGMLFGALGLMGRDTSITANVAYLVLLVFTGASVPLERVPAAVAACSHALPMTNGIAALRRLVAVGPDGQFWVWIGWEAIVAVGWISLTVVLLRWIEQLARRTGSVDFS